MKEKNIDEKIKSYEYSKREFLNITSKTQITYDEILDIKEKELYSIENDIYEKFLEQE